MEKPAFSFPPSDSSGGREPTLLAELLATRFKGLAEEGQTRNLEPGTPLVTEGQQATDLYILLEGEVEVMAPMNQDWVRVAVLGPGSAIGEMAFVDGLPRSARVIATTACSVLQITRDSFQTFAQREPNLAISFVLELSKTVAFRLRRLEQFDAAEAAKEFERKTLAAELHDQTLAELAGLAVELGFLSHQASAHSQELKLAVDEVRKLLKDADQGLRQIVQGIYPPVLTIMGLVPAVNSFLTDLASRPVPSPHPLEVHLVATGFDEDRLEEGIEICLYRVIQQGLANVIQHAQAKQVTIDLRWDNDEVTLMLSDDGVGFDVLNPKESHLTGHFGLANLKDRIERFLGRMEIESQPGKGTTFRAKIPVASAGAGAGAKESRVSTHILPNQTTPQPVD